MMTAAAAARKHDKLVAYVRVSSVDQNTERQLEAMFSYVREGDTLVVFSLDRLGRNLDDLRRLVSQLNDRGVAVQFLKENLTFTGDDSSMSKLLFNMLGSFAEF